MFPSVWWGWQKKQRWIRGSPDVFVEEFYDECNTHKCDVWPTWPSFSAKVVSDRRHQYVQISAREPQTHGQASRVSRINYEMILKDSKDIEKGFPRTEPTRVSLPLGTGCYTIQSRSDCCKYWDGRTGYAGQPCVLAKTTFSSNTHCEPLSWLQRAYPTASSFDAVDSKCMETDRTLLPANTGCYTIHDKEKCCRSSDSRSGYHGQDCVVARSHFDSGHVCEPYKWVEWKYPGLNNWKSVVDECGGRTARTTSNKVKAGSTYYVRVKPEVDEVGNSMWHTHFTHWKPVYVTCACDEASGDKSSEMRVWQEKDKVKVSWNDGTRCEEQIQLWRALVDRKTGKGGESTQTDTYMGPWTCGQKISRVSMHPATDLVLSSTYEFCLASRGKNDYVSSKACTRLQVHWVGTVTGTVRTRKQTGVSDTPIHIALKCDLDGGVNLMTDSSGNFKATLESSKPECAGSQTDRVVVVSANRTTNGFQHEYQCGARRNCFSQEAPVEHFKSTNVDFIDVSTFVLSGKVGFAGSGDWRSGQMEGEDCPVKGVTLRFVNADSPDQEFGTEVTDEHGRYETSVPIHAHVKIVPQWTVRGLQHTFKPEFRTVLVDGNTEAEPLLDVTKGTINATVAATLCKIPLGKSVLRIQAPKCSSYGRDLTISKGEIQADIELPAMMYSIEITGIYGSLEAVGHTPASIRTMFSNAYGSQIQDLEGAKTRSSSIEFLFQSTPKWEVQGLGMPEGCESAGMFVLPMLQPVVGKFVVWQDMKGQICKNVSGNVHMVDPTAEAKAPCAGQGCELKLSFDANKTLTSVPLAMSPVEPNVVGTLDYIVSLTYSAPAVTAMTAKLRVVVVGTKSRGPGFSAKLPDYLPSTIIRNPPGDGSWAKYTSKIQTTTFSSVKVKSSTSVGMKQAIGIGHKKALIVCSGAGGIVLAAVCKVPIVSTSMTTTGISINAGLSTDLSDSWSVSISMEESYKTSSYAGMTSDSADMFLIPGINIVDLSWNLVPRPNAMFWISDYDIRKHEIPALHMLLKDEKSKGKDADADRVEALEEAIQGWKDTLALNDELKRSAKPMEMKKKDQPGILSFSGGGQSYTFTKKLSKSKSVARDFTVKMDTEIFEKFKGLVKAGPLLTSVLADQKMKVSLSTKVTHKSTTTESETIQFSLSDRTVGDQFEVEVLEDPMFGTPIFHTVSGRSKCPWEPGTVQREAFKLTALTPKVRNVAPDKQGIIELQLTNLSPSRETNSYGLSPVLTSLKDGVELSLNGAPFVSAASFKIPPGSIKVVIAVKRGPLAFRFDDIKFKMFSNCEKKLAAGHGMSRSYLHSTVSVDVEFLEPCAEVNWAGKLARAGEWSVLGKPPHGQPKNQLRMIVHDPEYLTRPWAKIPRMLAVKPMYRRSKGAEHKNPWRPMVDGAKYADFLGTSDPAGFSQFTWNVEHIEDGEYEIKVQSRCEAIEGMLDIAEAFTQHNTPVLSGVIDRSGPVQFGQTKPAYGNFLPDMPIAIEFDEPIDCSQPYSFRVELRSFTDTTTTATHETRADENNKKSQSVLTKIGHAILKQSRRSWRNLVMKASSSHQTAEADSAEAKGKLVDFRVACEDRRIELALGPGTSYDEIMGGTLRVHIQGVQDMHGNEANTGFSWSFSVEQMNLEAMETTLHNLELHMDYEETGREGTPLREHFANRLAGEIANVVGLDSINRISIFNIRPYKEGTFVKLDVRIEPPADHDETAAVPVVTATRLATRFHLAAINPKHEIHKMPLLSYMNYDNPFALQMSRVGAPEGSSTSSDGSRLQVFHDHDGTHIKVTIPNQAIQDSSLRQAAGLAAAADVAGIKL